MGGQNQKRRTWQILGFLLLALGVGVSFRFIANAQTCTPSWSCTGWSACVNGTQTRACSDANSCGSQRRPLEAQACAEGPELITELNPPGLATSTPPDLPPPPTVSCTPLWSCTSWSACTNGVQTRTCTDANRCNTLAGKPSEQIGCTSPTPASCTPSWTCLSWSACTVNGIQTRSCTDANGCGTTAGKPQESQTCTAPSAGCTPTWSCTDWSTCANGVQTRSCTDSRACGSTSGKPPESQGCSLPPEASPPPPAPTPSPAETTTSPPPSGPASSAPPADTVPPVISNLTIETIGIENLVARWQTNEPATSVLEYGTSATLASPVTVQASALVTTHRLSASGLQPATRYSLRAVAADAAGNTGQSTILSVVTLARADDADGDGLPDSTDPDDDNDGVPDAQEQSGGTSPLLADSDGDGVQDSVDSFPLQGTESQDTDRDGIGDGVDPDDDNDGLLDAHERLLGSDPRRADSDGDGLPDGRDPDPTAPQPLTGGPSRRDSDSDGLLDSVELRLGTDPRRPDTDTDTVGDHRDAFALDPTESSDTDDDGLGDRRERQLGTDPRRADSDNDGYDDGTEVRSGHDPRSPAGRAQAAAGSRCAMLPTLRDRVQCRLQLPPAVRAAPQASGDLPESCRVAADPSRCLERSQSLQPCRSLPDVFSVRRCLRETLRVDDVGRGAAACRQLPAYQREGCLETLRLKVYQLVIARFTELQDRAIRLREFGATGEAVVEFIIASEAASVRFTTAKNTAERRAAILEVRTAWRTFAQTLSPPSAPPSP